MAITQSGGAAQDARPGCAQGARVSSSSSSAAYAKDASDACFRTRKVVAARMPSCGEAATQRSRSSVMVAMAVVSCPAMRCQTMERRGRAGSDLRYTPEDLRYALDDTEI